MIITMMMKIKIIDVTSGPPIFRFVSGRNGRCVLHDVEQIQDDMLKKYLGELTYVEKGRKPVSHCHFSNTALFFFSFWKRSPI